MVELEIFDEFDEEVFEKFDGEAFDEKQIKAKCYDIF